MAGDAECEQTGDGHNESVSNCKDLRHRWGRAEKAIPPDGYNDCIVLEYRGDRKWNQDVICSKSKDAITAIMAHFTAYKTTVLGQDTADAMEDVFDGKQAMEAIESKNVQGAQEMKAEADE